MSIELHARSPEGAALVATAERLADDLAAGAAARDRDRRYPFEGIAALQRAGYFGAPVPEPLGGVGVSSVHDAVIASSRLARGDASLAIGVNMHLVVVLNLARRWRMARHEGNARRQRAFGDSLRAIASGRVVIGRRDERAGPGSHPPRDAGRAHRGGLADRRPQDLLHHVPRGDRAGDLSRLPRRGRPGTLRLRRDPRRPRRA